MKLLGAVKEAPMKPTHAQCKALAGSPLLLAASEERAIREEWKRVMRVFKAAMRLSRAMRRWSAAETFKEVADSGKEHSAAEEALVRACAAAQRKGKRP